MSEPIMPERADVPGHAAIAVEASTKSPRNLTSGEFTTSAIVAAATTILGLIGFVNSFKKVAEVAEHSFGWFSWTVPLGIDIGIAVFSALDIVLARLDMRIRSLRLIPWGLTAATIYLNISGETDTFAIVAHAVLPMLWVIAVEVGAHVMRKRAGLASETRMDRIRKSRWVLSPVATFFLWRRMVLWEIRSYPLALQRERDRVLTKTDLQDRYGRRWRWKATRRERALYKLGELVPAGTETVVVPEIGTVPEDEAASVPVDKTEDENKDEKPKSEDRPRKNKKTKSGTVPSVEDLLPAGRLIAQQLAAEGRPLTRDNLLTEIRQKAIQVSTGRATELLRLLKGERAGQQRNDLVLSGPGGIAQ